MENKSFQDELRNLLTEHDKEVMENTLETFICRLINLRLINVNDDMYYEMLEVKDCLIKEKFDVEVKL